MKATLLTVVLLLLTMKTAHADGPWPGMSGVTATADSAMVTQSNPAGMSRLKDSEFILQLIALRNEYEDTVSIPDLGLSRESDDDNYYGGPLFYYVRPLSERVNFGLSLAIPAGFGDDYGSESPSRYFIDEWSLTYIALEPALSYKLNDQWSIGASIPINYARYTLDSAVLNPGAPDGEMELEADGVAISLRFGVLYQHDPQTRFGVTYRSAVDMELEGDPDFSGLSATTEARLTASGVIDADVEIGSKLPPVIMAGAHREFANGWSWAVDVGRIQWSEFKLTEFAYLDGDRFTREPDYDDVWAGSTGVSIPLNDRWTLGLGAGYTASPVSKSTRTFALRADEIWIAGMGVNYDRGGGRSIAVNLNYIGLGKGKIESDPVPVLGTLEAEYGNHWGLMLDVRFRWGAGS